MQKDNVQCIKLTQRDETRCVYVSMELKREATLSWIRAETMRR